MVRFSAAVLLIASGVGCTVGPKYQRPAAPVAPSWKAEAPFKPAQPGDSIPRGAWWQIFHDAELDRYEQQLLQQNFSLAAAKDRLEEARALARVAAAGYFPQAAVDPGIARQRSSANRPSTGATLPSAAVTQSAFTLPFAFSYEADVFGRVRRNLEAANASLQASAADAQNVELVLTAELAGDYFSLREIDAEAQVVQQSVEYQQRGLDLVQNRHRGGVASGLEVAQQQALLEATQAQFDLLQRQRDQFEHAIATLTGTPAPTFHIAAAQLAAAPPAIPAGVPSDLLQRRPDIASSERVMALQNARVGIATTAFYPHITLSGGAGLQSRDVTSLFSAPSAFWAIGADMLEPVFTGGRNRANLQFARAAYDESVANYRQSVLTAFQQVEDGLSGLAALSRAAATQQAAVDASRQALTIANNRYVGGLTTYLDVITAQSTLLANERLATQLLGQRMITSVALVKALGGGWDAAPIQTEQVRPAARQALQP